VTIGLAYLRGAGIREIVIASDSRLSGGETWDECQKVFPLRRGDCALVFAGAYYRFYPVFCQIVTFCDLHKRIYSRAVPIGQLSSKVQEVAQHLLSQVKDLPKNTVHAEGSFEFLLCGWNWENGVPFLRHFRYDDQTGKVSRRHIPMGVSKRSDSQPVYFIGDCVPTVKKNYNRTVKPTDVLDYEPIELVQTVIDSGEINTIGGVIQGVKIYRHLNSLPLAIKRQTERYVFGRQLFAWEEVEYEVANLDLDVKPAT
jgi:hypothetical protein